jgi:hypothetical protein
MKMTDTFQSLTCENIKKSSYVAFIKASKVIYHSREGLGVVSVVNLINGTSIVNYLQ